MIHILLRRVAAFVVCLLCVTHQQAHAIDRACSAGQFWNPSVGACMKKPVKRLTADDIFIKATDILEGKVADKQDPDAINMLSANCTAKHPASCQLLGFLHALGRSVTADNDKAARYYAESCALGLLDGCVDAAQLDQRIGQADVARKKFLVACEKGSANACTGAAEMAEEGAGGEVDDALSKGLFGKAFAMNVAACPASSAACHQLGISHWKGRGTIKDASKAYKLWTAACNSGYGMSCHFQAQALEQGFGVQEDPKGGIAIYERACRQYDSAVACSTMAERLAIDKREPEQTKQLAERACKLDSQYCATLGELYRIGFSVTADEKTASRLLGSACLGGGAPSCVFYAKRLQDGIGVTRDPLMARAMYLRACNAGNAAGCAGIAQLSADSAKTREEFEAALNYAKKACTGESGDGCNLAGALVASGKHSTKGPELKRAFEFYVSGCEHQSPSACSSAAEGYASGDQVAKDDVKAAELYDKACGGNGKTFIASACQTVSSIYERGVGVTVDLRKALLFSAHACEFNELDGCLALDRLAKASKASDKDKGIAVNSLDEVCRKHPGDIPCLIKGDLQSTGGTLFSKSAKSAFDLYSKSCAEKSDLGCSRLAVAYENGLGTSKDRPKALALWKSLCDSEVSFGCLGLAIHYDQNKQHNEAAPIMAAACELGNGTACTGAGYNAYVSRGGTRWDVALAMQRYQRGCELKDAIGCGNVGELFEYGIGVPADAKKAYEFYTKGCELGSPSSCGRSARSLARGHGVNRDTSKAEDLYRQACNSSAEPSPESCRELADLLSSQANTSPKPTLQADIARFRTSAFVAAKAFAVENPYYMWVLGTFYADGVATPKDPAAASEWYVKACDGYDPMGCLAAGVAFSNGSVAKNADRARVYYERACAAGVEAGCLGAGGAARPPAVTKKGCASCSSSELPRGSEFTFVAVLLIFFSRRRRA
jgi:uncharacterized protein